eukprot:g53666.t1
MSQAKTIALTLSISCKQQHQCSNCNGTTRPPSTCPHLPAVHTTSKHIVVLQEASALSHVRSAMHLAEKKYAQHLMELASTYTLRETLLPSISLAGSSQNLHVHQQQRKQQH